ESDSEDLLLLRLEVLVADDSLRLELGELLELLRVARLRRGSLHRSGSRLVVRRLVVHTLHRHLTARRPSRSPTRDSAAWSEHRLLLTSGQLWAEAIASASSAARTPTATRSSGWMKPSAIRKPPAR